MAPASADADAAPAPHDRITAIVLESKLHPPRPGLVERVGLLRRMLAAEAAVLVIDAPAGYGKSALAAQYAAVADRPVAWLSLDAADADPALLALELATAIDRVAPVDLRVFASLGSPAPPIERVVLPGVLNSIAAGGPTLIVLDDLHLIETAESLAIVSALCRTLPPGAQLLVASRDTSALPLGRLRVGGRLLELGWRDLALGRDEADHLMRSAGAPLEPHELDAMLKRTEGWPAAVSLEALALGGGGHRPAWGPPAHRADRDLVDYLGGAVLGRLPPERLAFLRRTSILDRFSAPLCDAVLDRRGSALEIAALEDSNLFVQPLDRGREWYRYHPLFRDAMRVELERAEADSVSELHLRASRWHEREGTPDEAVEHALAARDHARARDLMVGNARALINDGRLAAVRTWLAAFTEEHIAGSAPLALCAAWESLFHGERDRAQRYVALSAAAPWEGPGPNGEPSLEAAVALITGFAGWGGLTRMHAHAVTAYRLLPVGHPAHELSALGLGCSLMLLGRMERAVPFLEEASALGAARASAALVAHGVLAQIAVEEQRVEAAEASVRAGLGLIGELGLGESVVSVSVNAAVACLAAQGGDVERARLHLERALSALPRLGAAPWRSIRARALLGRAALALGDLDLAGSLLGAARLELTRYPDAGVLPRLLAGEERALDEARRGAGVLCDPISAAELRVLELLPTHLSSPEIGAVLSISPNTVKAHTRAIYRKLEATGRSEAVIRAGRLGLLSSV